MLNDIAITVGMTAGLILGINSFVGKRRPHETRREYISRTLVIGGVGFVSSFFVVSGIDALRSEPPTAECETGRNPALRAMDINDCPDWARRP